MRFSVDQTAPRARGVCDDCGFSYQLDQLRFKYQWQGPRLQNTRFLVCEACWDTPNEQLRTIVLPPDPLPVQNARPEAYVGDDNPLSAIGANASPLVAALSNYSGSRIGNLTFAGGIYAAFDGNPYKSSPMCASNTISNSSYNNWVGINWAGDVSGITTPSSLMAPVVQHTVTSFTAYAPSDKSFLWNGATDYVVQGSYVGTNTWGNWTTISSGTTAGTVGESITGTAAGALYQFHRIAFLGDQLSPASIAQVKFSVGESGQFA